MGSAFSQARAKATPSFVLITTSRGMFFSNGLNLPWVELPPPQHKSGNAFIASSLALCHDYVIMRSDRGVMYLNKVDLELTCLDNAVALFRAKIGSAQALCDLVLQGLKIRGEEAVTELTTIPVN
ncbi:hypothetical protein Q3G72_004075 [Acer saccharum]|nr:hypothetical protein Q3G72_004075 [Acer saccharum]